MTMTYRYRYLRPPPPQKKAFFLDITYRYLDFIFEKLVDQIKLLIAFQISSPRRASGKCELKINV
jgi:hypothetical protein